GELPNWRGGSEPRAWRARATPGGPGAPSSAGRDDRLSVSSALCREIGSGKCRFHGELPNWGEGSTLPCAAAGRAVRASRPRRRRLGEDDLMSERRVKVARRAEVPPFAVMDIIAEANRRRAAGRPVLNMCAGEPATGASDVVRERASAILASGQLGYTEALGAPALRAGVAARYRRGYDVELVPARVAVTTGSSGGFMLAFLAAFDVGDRVVLARPGYPAYRNVLAALGCEVVEIDCGPEVRYQPT